MAKKMLPKFAVDLLKPSSLALLNSLLTSYCTVGLKMKKTNLKNHFFRPCLRPVEFFNRLAISRQKIGKNRDDFLGDFLGKNRRGEKIVISWKLADFLPMLVTLLSSH